MDVTLLARATEEFAGYLSEVTDSELTAETPCAGWTIEDLFHHMIDENVRFGQSIDPQSRLPQIQQDGALRETVYRAAARYALETVADIAGTPELRTRFDLHLANTLIHTWDLASAIEFDLELPSAHAIDIARSRIRRIPSSQRGVGKDFENVADFPASSAMEDLLILSGRSPAWRAGVRHPKSTARLVFSLQLSRQRNKQLQTMAESRGIDATTLTRQWIMEKLDETDQFRRPVPHRS